MKAAISCREAVRRLWRFLDGELEGDERQTVEEHLDFCVHCCGELEFAGELRGLLGTQKTVELPGDVRTRLETFVDQLEEVDDLEDGTEEGSVS